HPSRRQTNRRMGRSLHPPCRLPVRESPQPLLSLMTQSASPRLSSGNFHYWQHLTAAEIQALAGEAVVILPIASTEQHGPHMVTGTDTLLNELMQKGVAADPPVTGTYLLLPTLTVGSSEHHIPFGGTLTLPPTLY